MKLSQAKAILIQAISKAEGIELATTTEVPLNLVQNVKHKIMTPEQAANVWIRGYSAMCNKAFTNQ